MNRVHYWTEAHLLSDYFVSLRFVIILAPKDRQQDLMSAIWLVTFEMRFMDERHKECNVGAMKCV